MSLKIQIAKRLPKFVINYFQSRRLKILIKLFEKIGEVPMPEKAIIDPVNICNLSCPLCPTGRKLLRQNQQMMKLLDFIDIIDKLDNVKHLSLFNWGEPFLNPETILMIRYAKENGIYVSLHTNFSLPKPDEFFKELATSGLDHLEVSIDGTNQENYSIYRKGGDFEMVLENIKSLIEAKEKAGSKYPKITWKFIVNRHNQNYISEAKKWAKGLGIYFELTTIGLGDDLPDCQFPESLEDRMTEWLPKKSKFIRSLYRKHPYGLPLYNQTCSQLFDTITIGPDGNVFPCCWITDGVNSWGNLLEANSLEEIWNNDYYKSARSLFSRSKNLSGAKEVVCHRCNNFNKSKG